MIQDQKSQAPLDGIALPQSSQDSNVKTDTMATKTDFSPDPGKRIHVLAGIAWISLIVIALVYIGFALYLYSHFPTQDGSDADLKKIGAVTLLIGMVISSLFGLIGCMRIALVKKKNARIKIAALLRLLAGITPVIAVSVLTLFAMKKEPTFSLQVLPSASGEQLVAPVSVTFGMQDTLAIFQKLGFVPLKYQWDFTGDGIFDQETFDPQATFIASRSGIYQVTANVTMTNGISKQVSLRLLVPRESFSLEPVDPIVDEPASFSVEHLLDRVSQGAPTLLKAKWDFDGDGVIDTETSNTSSSYTYRRLGPVSVNVTIIFSNQTQTSYQRRIEVVKPPEQPFPITLDTEPATLLGTPPFGAVFTLKTKEPIANASWDFGDGKTGEGLRIAHVYSIVGSFTVNATIRSQSGATARLSKVIRITNPLSLPDLSFQGSPDVIGNAIQGEVPLVVDITPITSQPLISFAWDAQNASEVLATDKSFHAVYRDTGRYFLDLIAVDPDQNVFRKRIIINAKSPESVVRFTMDPATPTAPATVTFDASDTFVAAGEEITGFVWEYGDGKTENESKFSGSRITHLYDEPGTYVIGVTIQTTSGKTYSSKQTLLVKAPIIDACFMPSRTSGKAPLGVFFDSSCSAGEFESMLWDFGDGAQSDQKSPTHVFIAEGKYQVMLSATTKDGRKSQKTSTITVTTE